MSHRLIIAQRMVMAIQKEDSVLFQGEEAGQRITVVGVQKQGKSQAMMSKI